MFLFSHIICIIVLIITFSLIIIVICYFLVLIFICVKNIFFIKVAIRNRTENYHKFTLLPIISTIITSSDVLKIDQEKKLLTNYLNKLY